MRYKTIIRLIFFCFGTLFIQNCLDPYQPPIVAKDHRFLVVQGFLVDNAGVSNDSTIIQLGRTTTVYSPDPPPTELRALVQVEEEGAGYLTLTSRGNGIYSLPPTRLNPEKKYRLRIKAENVEYLSDFEPVRKSPLIDSVVWRETPDGIDFSVNARDPENKTGYYLWNFDETWKYTSSFLSKLVFENGHLSYRSDASGLNTCWKSAHSIEIMIATSTALQQDVIHEFDVLHIPAISQKLYYGFSLLVNQYALTEEAYTYWFAARKANKEVGGFFGPQPTQLSGNLHRVGNPDEPVIGYFSVSSVTHKRIQINRQQITGPSQLYGPTGYEDCKEQYMPVEELSESALAGLLIIEDLFIDGTVQVRGYRVSPKECIDCRYHGGTLTRPAYWK